MTETRTIEIFADTRGRGRCNGCGAQLVWGEVVKSGKRMCFEAPAVPVSTRNDDATRRPVEAIAFDENHWARCPKRDRFKR